MMLSMTTKNKFTLEQLIDDFESFVKSYQEDHRYSLQQGEGS
jgi:hypothetical protein